MANKSLFRVLFVCLGNICRSPMAEGTFRALVQGENLQDIIGTDSAGTGSWHVGSPPDRRAQGEMASRGYGISDLRARQVSRADFDAFDLVLAMDYDNLEDLQNLAGAQYEDKVRLFLDFADGEAADEVPDPYHGGPDGFAHVLDLVEAASRGLLAHVRARLDP